MNNAITLTDLELQAVVGGDGATAAVAGGVVGGGVGAGYLAVTAGAVPLIEMTALAIAGPIGIGIVVGAAVGYGLWYWLG